MRCTQVADRPFPDREFTSRDWVIAVVICPNATHRFQAVDDHEVAIEARIHNDWRHQLESVGSLHLVGR